MSNNKILEAVNEIGCRIDDELDICRISLRDADHILKGSKFVLTKLEEHVKNYKEEINRKAKMNASPTQQQVQQNLVNEIAMNQINILVQIVKNENIVNERNKATKESELSTLLKSVGIVKKYYDELNQKFLLEESQSENNENLEQVIEPNNEVSSQITDSVTQINEQIIAESVEEITEIAEVTNENESHEFENQKNEELDQEETKKQKKSNPIIELSRQIRDKKKSNKNN